MTSLSNPGVVMEFRRMDSGSVIVAGTGHPDYRIMSPEGLTGLGYTFATSVNPQVPGVEIQNRRAEPRYIDVEIDCSNELRQKAIAFFNPLFKMKVTVTWNGVTRWIYGYAMPVKVIAPNVYATITLRVQLYCPDPLWNDMSDYGKDITFRQPLLAFPFAITRERGLVASYRVFGNSVTVNNTGDTPAPIRVLFQAVGNVSDPRVTLNDGAYVQVNVSMGNGDSLDINTDPKDIYVRMNGQSVLNKTDKMSTYFQLPAGENTISYQAGGPLDALSVIVYFTPQYLGV